MRLWNSERRCHGIGQTRRVGYVCKEYGEADCGPGHRPTASIEATSWNRTGSADNGGERHPQVAWTNSEEEHRAVRKTEDSTAFGVVAMLARLQGLTSSDYWEVKSGPALSAYIHTVTVSLIASHFRVYLLTPYSCPGR